MKINSHTISKQNRGFTLIELLVVIAVIGILASVILAALNKAKDQGNVSKIEQMLTSAKSQAEIYRNNPTNNFSYTGMCTIGATDGIADTVVAAGAVFGFSATNANLAGSQTLGNPVVCHINAAGDQWAASAPLAATVVAGTTFWCVDSSGFSRATTNKLGTNTVCQ